MKYEIIASKKFRRDVKVIRKRGYNLALLDDIVTCLASGGTLLPKYRDHELKGDYVGCRECHITPDWLLIYEIDESTLYLYLTRTGSHSDLF